MTRAADFSTPFASQVEAGADGVRIDPELLQTLRRGPVVRPGRDSGVLRVVHDLCGGMLRVSLAHAPARPQATEHRLPVGVFAPDDLLQAVAHQLGVSGVQRQEPLQASRRAVRGQSDRLEGLARQVGALPGDGPAPVFTLLTATEAVVEPWQNDRQRQPKSCFAALLSRSDVVVLTRRRWQQVMAAKRSASPRF